MSFDPKGQRSNKKVIKVTDITCRSPIFSPGTPLRVAFSYTTQAKNV